jgi:hypothetical protein
MAQTPRFQHFYFSTAAKKASFGVYYYRNFPQYANFNVNFL